MPQPLEQRLASELSIRPQQVQATIALLDEGATVPFIARYRKEVTGFVNELKSELSNDDVVKNADVIALAKSYSNDDVLFLIENNAKKVYRIYHLTYSKCNAKGFHRYIEFEDINSIREYLEKEFISDFIEI